MLKWLSLHFLVLSLVFFTLAFLVLCVCLPDLYLKSHLTKTNCTVREHKISTAVCDGADGKKYPWTGSAKLCFWQARIKEWCFFKEVACNASEALVGQDLQCKAPMNSKQTCWYWTNAPQHTVYWNDYSEDISNMVKAMSVFVSLGGVFGLATIALEWMKWRKRKAEESVVVTVEEGAELVNEVDEVEME